MFNRSFLLAAVMAAMTGTSGFAEGRTGVFEFIGFSTPIMPDINVGFPGMNKVCQDDFANPDARICTTTEYVLSPTAVLPGSESWIQEDAIDISRQGNCLSWTSATSTQGGLTVRTDGTFSRGDNCGTSKPVVCCARVE